MLVRSCKTNKYFLLLRRIPFYLKFLFQDNALLKKILFYPIYVMRFLKMIWDKMLDL